MCIMQKLLKSLHFDLVTREVIGEGRFGARCRFTHGHSPLRRMTVMKLPTKLNGPSGDIRLRGKPFLTVPVYAAVGSSTVHCSTRRYFLD